MSLESWKAEFYPVEPNVKMTWLEAVQHSIQKWIGLRKENLRKHIVRISCRSVLEYGENKVRLQINGSTCALCVKSTTVYTNGMESVICSNCPLAQVRNGTPCDETDPSQANSPYIRGVFDRDPEPMIQWLQKAEELVLRRRP